MAKRALPENEAPNKRLRSAAEEPIPKSCPYLGSINRHVLDFDFEKICSITLSRQRPYGCLTCGKFLQGKGPTTQAYLHSLSQGHHLFINLENATVWCLPDDYEVIDKSLNDIKYHLHPTFDLDEVKAIGRSTGFSRALDGTEYYPGFIGLNNLNKTDSYNVVLQLLCRVTPLRNLLLLKNFYLKQNPDPVLLTFSQLMKKIFNRRNFKGLVSPHEFLQVVGVESGKMFKIGKQSDPVAFLSWIIHRLHAKLRLSKIKDDSVVSRCFRGKLREGERGDERPFWLVSLQLPVAPIFRDEMEGNSILQVPVSNILESFF